MPESLRGKSETRNDSETDENENADEEEEDEEETKDEDVIVRKVTDSIQDDPEVLQKIDQFLKWESIDKDPENVDEEKKLLLKFAEFLDETNEYFP